MTENSSMSPRAFPFFNGIGTISTLSVLEENQSHWLRSLQEGLTIRLNSPSVKEKTFYVFKRQCS